MRAELGVSHPTVSKTIARLKREGLVTARPYRGIFLTEAGVAMAKSVRQRHRLVVELLIAVGAPRDAAEADAEGIEHYVSNATLRAFEAFLRNEREPSASDRRPAGEGRWRGRCDAAPALRSEAPAAFPYLLNA